jgi:hypothetical protein
LSAIQLRQPRWRIDSSAVSQTSHRIRIEATNISHNGLDHFDDIIGLAGFGLNCLDDFNGIIGLVGFSLIGCIGFIVGIIGLIMLVKLVGLVGLFDCISEPALFDLNFNNRSVIGKLNFLAQTACLNIIYATHQIAKYPSDPRTSHGEAVLYLICYLKKTRDLGLLFKPDCNRDFEFYCDADFSGLWNKALAPVDPSTSKSLSGWIIFYAGCPVSWASKFQSQVELSTTKAEYIAMSQALKDIIPITGLLQEMGEQDFKVLCTKPYAYCKIFEDNSGALELARFPKLCPRTKHINVCYHHFREHVGKGLIKIFPVDTKDQIADALTKPLAQNDFQRHRRGK